MMLWVLVAPGAPSGNIFWIGEGEASTAYSLAQPLPSWCGSSFAN